MKRKISREVNLRKDLKEGSVEEVSEVILIRRLVRICFRLAYKLLIAYAIS